MECTNCGYYYADFDDSGLTLARCYCHWTPRAPGEVAPCDEEDEYIPNDYYGDEDEGDDIHACMIESLGNNWW